MIRTFQFKIEPNVEQRLALLNIFSFCKNLFNASIQERKSYYKRYHKSLSYEDQAKELVGIKNIFCETKDIHSNILQGVLKQVDLSFKNFFRRIKKGSESPGFPRFKNIDRFKSS